MSADLADDFDNIDPRLLGADLTPAEAAWNLSTPVVIDPVYWRLIDLGVPVSAIAGPNHFASLAVEMVCFLPGARFEFASSLRDQSAAVLGIVVPVVDAWGCTADLVASSLETGATASWRGAALLGEGNLVAPRIVDDGRLRVHASVLEWLRDDRRGIVVLDAKRAAVRLAGQKLIVADSDFGERLDGALRLPRVDIHVDDEPPQRAAA